MPRSVSRLLWGLLRCERGVVSIEWVAIAAVLAVGAVTLAGVVMTGLATPATNIAGQLSP